MLAGLLDVSESGDLVHGKGGPPVVRQRDDMIYLDHIRTAFQLSNRATEPAHAP